MAKDIKTRVAIEGESQYRAALKNINSELKALQSGLKTTAAEFQGQANSQQALSAKVSALQGLLNAERNKIDTLKSAITACQAAETKWTAEISKTQASLTATNAKLASLDSETLKAGQTWNTYSKQLDSAEAELKELQNSTGDTTAEQAKLQAKIDGLKQKMSDLDEATGGAASETGALLQEQTNLEGQLGKQQTALDGVQKKTNDFTTQLNNAQTEAYNLEHELDKTNAQLEEASRSADGCAHSIDEYGNEVKDAADSTGDMAQGVNALSSIMAAAGLAQAFEKIKDAVVDCVETFADFESTMSKVAALSGASATELDALSEAAKDAGATTSYTATQAGEALSYMALAGWDSAEMLDGLNPILDLAAASAMDLGTASDIVTDYLTAFGLAASDAADFADMMAYAQANSNTTTEQLGEAYKNCAATMASFGVSAEETTAVLMTMANAGVKGGEAGTTLRAIMTRLATNTKGAADALSEYGVEVYDAQGNMNSLSSILDGLNGIWGTLTDQQQASLAKTIAGQNQYTGLQTILNGLGESAVEAGMSFGDYAEALEHASGTAGQQASTMLDNLAGRMTLAESATDALKTEIGGQLEPALSTLVEAFTSVIGGITEFIQEHEEAVPILAGVTAGLGALTAGMTVATAAAGIMAIATTALGATLLPIVGTLAAVAAGVAIMTAAFVSSEADAVPSVKELTSASRELNDVIEDGTDGYNKTVEATEATIQVAQGYIDKLAQLESQGTLTDAQQQEYNQTCALLTNLMPELADQITTSRDEFGNLTYEVQGGTQALQDYINQWKINAREQAQTEFMSQYYEAYNAAYSELYQNEILLTEAKAAESEAQEKLNGLVERYDELTAKKVAGNATDAEIDELATLGDQIDQTRNNLEELSYTTETYQSVVDSGNESLANAETAVNDAKEAMDEYNARLDEGTEAQTEATEATEQTTDAYEDLAAAADEARESGGNLRSAYESLVEQFEAIEEEGNDASIALAEQALELLNIAATAEELELSYGGMVESLGLSTDQIAEYLVKSGSDFEEFQANVESNTASIINNFDEMSTDLGMTVDEMAQNLSANITAQNQWSENIALMWNAAVASGDAGKMAFVQTLYDMGPEAAVQVQSMVDNVDGTLDQFGPLFSEAAQGGVSEAALGAAMAAGEVYDAVADVAADAVEGYTDEDFEGAGAESAEEIASGAESEAAQVENAATELGQSVINVWSGMSSDFQKAGYDAAAKISTGMRGNVGAVRTSATTVAQTVRSAINSISWNGVGYNISTGIAQGIRSGTSSITNAAKSAAQTAYNTAKTTLDIHSPSRVMAEVGRYYDEGFAEGITANIDKIADAVAMATEVTIPDVTQTAQDVGATYITNYNGQTDSSLAGILNRYLPAMLRELENSGGTQITGAQLAGYVDQTLGQKATRKARGN